MLLAGCIVAVLLLNVPQTLSNNPSLKVENGEGARGICTDADLVQEFRSFTSFPLSVSPDQSLVAYSAPGAGKPYGIIIQKLADKQIVSETYSELPIVRFTWRPDSAAALYFIQNPDTSRTLYLLDLRAKQTDRIEIPKTHNQYEVKWAPNSSAFAFSSDKKELFVVNDKSTLSYPGEFISFSWNKCSDKIAAILQTELADGERSTALQIITLSEKDAASPFKIKERGRLVSVEWEPYSEILVRSQDKANGKSCILIGDLSTSKIVYRAAGTGEISRPIFAGDTATLLWGAQSEDGWRNIALGTRGLNITKTFTFAGAANFRSFSKDRRFAILAVNSPAAREIVRIDLYGQSAPEVLASAKSVEGVTQEVINIHSDHRTVTAYLARRPGGQKASSAIVIRMLGGAFPQHDATWSEMQFYLNNGVDYLSVPNKTPHGVADLIVAVDYAKNNLGFPKERIVVYGASSAATIALSAALKKPQLTGTLLITGLVRPPDMTANKLDSSIVLFAFHGENDPFPWPHAQQMLLESVGRAHLTPPLGLWHVFPGEAHSLNLADSYVHATILKHLKALSR